MTKDCLKLKLLLRHFVSKTWEMTNVSHSQRASLEWKRDVIFRTTQATHEAGRLSKSTFRVILLSDRQSYCVCQWWWPLLSEKRVPAKWKSHTGKQDRVPAKWKARTSKCKSGLRALIFCELERFGQSLSFALKGEKLAGSCHCLWRPQFLVQCVSGI